MIDVYGIKNCDSVRKAVKYFKTHGIEYRFHDFRESPVDASTIRSWIEGGAKLSGLFNTRGTPYRTRKLKTLDPDDNGKIDWMAKENMLIKRPVVVTDEGKVLVGYDESLYRSLTTRK